MILKRFRPYFVYLEPVRVQFGLGLLFGIIYAVSSGAGIPLIIDYLVPLVTQPDKPDETTILGILMVIPAVFFFRAMGSFLNSYLIAYSGMYVLERLRRSVFDRIQQLPIAFFHSNKIGDLMARVLNDTSQLQGAVVKVVDSLVKEPATLIAASGFLIWLSFQEQDVSFILIALASIPLCVLPIKFIGKRILRKARLAQRQAGELNHVLNENLSATREIRAYNLEAAESTRFANACRRLFKLNLKVVKYDKLLTPLIELVTSIAIVFALYAAVQRGIDEGALAAILTALYMCYQPVKKLGAISNTIRKAEASLDRLEYVLDAKDSVPDAEDPLTPATLDGAITFDNVTFRYEDEAALKQVSVKIEPGESIALVGPSGAGKSTFANLVPRFYDANTGSVCVGGINVRQLEKASLRNQISLVSQEAILFSGSIESNIQIGRPDASPEDVRQAARLAYADEFIREQENGYDTEVGERGSRLSGGQRQRISIARAFLKDAPIIILDEPTSALDAESEHKIQAALEELSKGRTVLIIAHRFSTIQHADRILVFSDGEIVATGTHTELYASNALYKSLYDKQVNTALSAENPDP